MTRRIAVLNAGAATLKVAVYVVDGTDIVDARRSALNWPDTVEPAATIQSLLKSIEGPIDAVGHRVVHGGMRLRETVLINATVETEIERLGALAPLHNELALQGIRGARRVFPESPAYAVFDTAFHANRTAESMCYALPADLVEAFELRRYGFHGIAHASLTEQLAESSSESIQDLTAVTLQLGSGCSAAAIYRGCSVETSMGYTPLEGLIMTSRCGDMDPAIVLTLMRAGYAADEIEQLLTRRAGLLGLCGSADVREILAREAAGDMRAGLALKAFVRRIVLTVGAYLTVLEGQGAIVFGGGIGTHSAEIRRRVTEGLKAWNVVLDPTRNAAGIPGRISTKESRGVYLFTTDEEGCIARDVIRMLAVGR